MLELFLSTSISDALTRGRKTRGRHVLSGTPLLTGMDGRMNWMPYLNEDLDDTHLNEYWSLRRTK